MNEWVYPAVYQSGGVMCFPKEYYALLNDLRESGEINMFAAGPYLQSEFGLDKQEAKRVVLHWMSTYKQHQEVA